MATYIALLRGINVAGQKLIKMDDLRGCFESMGFKNVRTYIQSGNIIFQSKAVGATLIGKIEKALLKSFGSRISVFLRTLSEFEAIVKADPFGKVSTHPDSKMFISFMTEKLKTRLKVPFWSTKKDVEIIAVLSREIFSLSHPVKGRFGFPNNFVEKEFGVVASTRNWNTVRKLADIATYKY